MLRLPLTGLRPSMSASGPSPTSGDVGLTAPFGGKRTSGRELLHAVYEYTAWLVESRHGDVGGIDLRSKLTGRSGIAGIGNDRVGGEGRSGEKADAAEQSGKEASDSTSHVTIRPREASSYVF
jgi:hypothetical protein